MWLDTRLSTRLTAGLICLLAASALVMWLLEHGRQHDAYVAGRSANLDKSLQTESMRLKQQIDVLRRDVLFLSNTPPVSGIVRAAQNGGVDPRDKDSLVKWKGRLHAIFSAFSQAHPDYYRIRYIGIEDDGRSIVDVDNRNPEVAGEHSERYGKRDFMVRTLELPKGDVYLSEIENSQIKEGGVSVQTLHAATAIHDDSGKPFGIIVVNLDIERLLNLARDGVADDVEVYVADMTGRYLLQPTAARIGEAEPPGGHSFMHDFPILAPVFRPGESGSWNEPLMTLSDDGQMFEAIQLHFDPGNPQRFMVLGYRIPDVVSGGPSSMALAGNLVAVLIGMLLVGAAAMRLLRNTFQPLELLATAAERMAAGERDVDFPQGGVAEIGRLTLATAAMLGQLLQREQDILRANTELERHVNERTLDLSFSNELLQSAVDETRRRQQQAAIELRRNQALMATSMDGIHVMDIDGNLVEVNDAFCRMLGYTREEVMKLNVADWDVQWSREELRERFEYLIGRSELFETKHRRKDGTVIDVEISTSGIELDGIQLLFASSRDITARKQAEAAMKQHEKIIETAIDGFWMTDMEGVLLEVNQAYADISGYSMDELVGMHISQIEAIEHSDETRRHIEKIMKEGYDRFETRHRRKDGRIVDIEVSTTYLAGHERMFVFCRDISQRKRDELDRQIAAVAFDTQDAIVITDAKANIVRVNHAFERITGYSAAEVIGKNPRIMSSGRHDKAFYEKMWNSLKEDGAWSGEIWDRRKNGLIYPRWMTITAVRNDRNEVIHYVGIFSDITERKRAEDEIRSLAFYDTLTSLPNRRLLLERLRAALATSARNRNFGAVLFLDMDRFKLLNDTLGHEYGDMMLVEVARRIKSCVREVDTVARLGGDEFVVLLEGVGDSEPEAEARAGSVAEKIRETLATPYRLRDQEHLSTPSIGVVLYQGNDEPPDTLLRHSDMAMYGAKKCGRNAVCFFDPSMDDSAGNGIALAEELDGAIGRGELVLYFQALVDGSRRPVGAEALLRWRHPERGLLLPDAFLPLAEKSEAIIGIDRWVMSECCAQLARWALDKRTASLTLSANVSSRLFAHPEFVAYVAEMLARHGVRPELLQIEPTEGMVQSDLQVSVLRMHELKTLGVGVSLDDFGGYSSLSCLKQLPVDKIKICRSFVQGISSDASQAALVEAIVDLAGNFGLRALAEGVETEEQMAFLLKLGVTCYQGFLFGEPVPIDVFESSLGMGE